jgi:peptidyl-dipeptidase Dcp
MKPKPFMCALFLVVLAACKQGKTDNPFFSDYNTPFEVPAFDRIHSSHFMPAFLKGFDEQKAAIDKIIDNPDEPTFENTIKALEYSGDLLTRVYNVFGPLTSANTNDTLQAINKELAPLASKHRDDINLNEKLFERVKAVYDKLDQLNLTDEEKMVVENRYKDFIRGGAALSPEDKEKLRKINEELSVLTVQFGDNLLKETNAYKLVINNEEDLAGLPDGLCAQAASTAKNRGIEGKWVFTLQAPSIFPFLVNAENRGFRQQIFTAYNMRGNNGNEQDNKAIVEKITRLRLERSLLLGYENYAQYALERNMAKTPEKVFEFLTQIWDAAIPVAKREAADQQKIIDAEGGNFKLEPWDWWYYSEKIKKAKYAVDDEDTRPYFEINNVRQGMFYVANRLYGLEFKEKSDIPKYHPEVITYEVTRGGHHVGVLMIDNYPRTSKRGGAWCTTYRTQHRDIDRNMITPIVSMVTNFTPPEGDKPSLLTAEETSTMFHEFGHALHQLLSNSTYPSVSGTSVPRDFVELPSQIMEHWVLEPEVLKVYARHYQTGEVIPQDLIDKLDKASKFNQGFITTEYLAASLLDMEYHTVKDTMAIAVVDFEKKAMEKYGLIHEIIPRYRSTYFSHIFSGGYSAGYYSYIWCEMLDADAFKAFKETGDIFNREVAAAFEREILSKGGSRDAHDMYLAFRGREPSVDAVLENRGLKK